MPVGAPVVVARRHDVCGGCCRAATMGAVVDHVCVLVCAGLAAEPCAHARAGAACLAPRPGGAPLSLSVCVRARRGCQLVLVVA